MHETDRRPYSVAIVGMGPRGLSVLERLLIRLRQDPVPEPTVIWAVEPVEHGPGRVWRTNQPSWFTTNATASELTARSPDSYLSGRRFAHPASLREWVAATPCDVSPFDPVDYPPRRVYGEYLKDVFRRLCDGAPPGVDVRRVLGEATGLTRGSDGFRLRVDVGGCGPAVSVDVDVEVDVDKVVLATGHSSLVPSEEQEGLLRHGRGHGRTTYFAENMAPDLPLDEVPAGAVVAVRGLGLTFYDIVRAFSIGRGGTFVRASSGHLRYLASGDEPRVVAGARRGLPFLARARVAEPAEVAPHPVVLTEGRIAELRAMARAGRGTTKLDFAQEVEPLIWAEMAQAYYACAIRRRSGDEAAHAFRSDFLAAVDRRHVGGAAAYDEVVARHGLDDMPRLRLDVLAGPFHGRGFARPAAFDQCLLDVLRADVRESRDGPRTSPTKAALEVLRRTRPLLPAVVDFGGLLPASHRDFLERFEPMSYLLSAGPPDAHVEELVALIEAGVVRVVGPEASFEPAPGSDRYVVASPHVAGSRTSADVLIEARVPGTDITRSTSPLLRQMAADGMVSEFVNTDSTTGESFATGGLAVSRAPFHVIGRSGTPDPDVYAIGVAADRTRWFTQVGTGRPGQESPFCRDADAIAADVLAGRPTAHRAADRAG